MKNKIPEWLSNFPTIGFAFFAIAVLITITYFFMLATAGKRTKKFIFASAKETVYFDIATRFVAFGLVFLPFMPSLIGSEKQPYITFSVPDFSPLSSVWHLAMLLGHCKVLLPIRTGKASR